MPSKAILSSCRAPTKRQSPYIRPMPARLCLFLLLFAATPSSAQESDYLGPRWASYATLDGSAPVRLILAYISQQEISPVPRPSPTVFSVNYIPPTRCDSLLDSLATTSFADSLYQIFGRPNIDIKTLPDSLAGQYDIRSHTITLARHSGVCSEIPAARIAFVHELAHAFQATLGDILGDIWSQYNIRPPQKHFASYAAQDITEHQAEALSAAINLLSVISNPSLGFGSFPLKNLQGEDLPPIITDRRSSLATSLDQYVPGTLILARLLLSHPLYKNHPLHAHPVPYLHLSPVSITWPTPHPLTTELRMRIRASSIDMGVLGPDYRSRLRAERLLVVEEATVTSPASLIGRRAN